MKMVHLPFIFFYLLCSFAYLADPSQYPFMGVLGLLFPAALLAQVLFTLFWLWRGSKFAIGSLFVLLLGWSHFSGVFQFGNSPSAEANGQAFKVLTYNIHYWQSYLDEDMDSTRKELNHMIAAENPDLIFLQENIEIEDFQAIPLPHKHHVRMTDHTSYGLGFASRYPFIDKGEVNYTRERGGYQKFAWVDVLIDSTVVRAINVHMVNTSLRPEQYQTLTGGSESELTGERLEEESRDIYRRLRDSYEIRGSQVNDLVTFIQNSPHPVILAGDFNDTPTGYVYRSVEAELEDAFKAAGKGTGDSYNKISFVPLRIDYIFSNPEAFRALDHKVIQSQWSDHKPVVAEFILTPSAS